jgi:hypothetical protein
LVFKTLDEAGPHHTSGTVFGRGGRVPDHNM